MRYENTNSNLKESYKYIVVGSGAGGAAIANELSKKNKDILIIEKGKDERKNFGTAKGISSFGDYYGFFKVPRRTIEGHWLMSACLVGGLTMVSCGSAYLGNIDSLMNNDIRLDTEIEEIKKEVSITPLAESLISNGSKKILKAAIKLGYKMKPMPKFINPKKCISCGDCNWGCKRGARWTVIQYLNDAIDNGVEILCNTEVDKISIINGKINGVICKNQNKIFEIKGEKVILSAGGLNTPIILKKSGIENAGENLFIDPFINIYGIINDNSNQYLEPSMSLLDLEFHDKKKFLLSPHVHRRRVTRFAEKDISALFKPEHKLLGIMVKIGDDNNGKVFLNNEVTKPLTDLDWEKLNTGLKHAEEILLASGAPKKTIYKSNVQGAHLGGTAAIGKIINKNLETEIKNLFVCDLSVFPESPGLPPILTLVALGKWLGKRI